MGRTSAFIAGFEKAANAFKLLMPAAKSFSGKAGGMGAKTTKIAPKAAAPVSMAKPVGSYGVPTRAQTTTPMASVSPQAWSGATPKKGRWSRSKKPVDVVKVNNPPTPSTTGKGGPTAVTTAAKTPPSNIPAPKDIPAAKPAVKPGLIERARQSINSPRNKARTYVGMGVVGTGAGLYGAKKILDSTIGPSRTENDW